MISLLPSPYVLSTVLLISIAAWALINRKRAVNAPYPPGPKGLPLIQNLFDIPSKKEFTAFTEWGYKYGQ